MGSISQQELQELQASGATVEVEPQTVVIEGLNEAISNMQSASSHGEILNVLHTLIDKLDTSTTVKCEPVVETTHHSHNENKIVVDTTPIKQAIEKLCQRPDYQFTVNRNARGQIESMDARIVDNGNN